MFVSNSVTEKKDWTKPWSPGILIKIDFAKILKEILALCLSLLPWLLFSNVFRLSFLCGRAGPSCQRHAWETEQELLRQPQDSPLLSAITTTTREREALNVGIETREKRRADKHKNPQRELSKISGKAVRGLPCGQLFHPLVVGLQWEWHRKNPHLKGGCEKSWTSPCQSGNLLFFLHDYIVGAERSLEDRLPHVILKLYFYITRQWQTASQAGKIGPNVTSRE